MEEEVVVEVCSELGGTDEVCIPESMECLVFIFLMVRLSSSSGLGANLLFAASPRGDLVAGLAMVVSEFTVKGIWTLDSKRVLNVAGFN